MLSAGAQALLASGQPGGEEWTVHCGQSGKYTGGAVVANGHHMCSSGSTFSVKGYMQLSPMLSGAQALMIHSSPIQALTQVLLEWVYHNLLCQGKTESVLNFFFLKLPLPANIPNLSAVKCSFSVYRT